MSPTSLSPNDAGRRPQANLNSSDYWDVAPDPGAIVDRDGVVRAINRAWSSALGWTRDETIGQPFHRFAARGASDPRLAALLRGDAGDAVELSMRGRDERPVSFAWVAAPVDDGVSLSGRRVVATAQTEIQLADAKERLAQAQKMEAFGQLTGGIAHDFNNLLQAVSGSLEMLGRKHVHRADGQRLIGLASQALDRASHLTRQLLAFARKQSLEARSLDTDEALNASIDLAQRSLGESITLERRFTPGVWPIVADPNQLDVAILNVIINARDAMPRGGSIVVSTANVVVPGTDAPPEVADGQYVRISIADTGSGMSEETRARVFEPFFTTKDVGKGTGLGLSQVHGFAHQSGGGIRLDSVLGSGTTMSIYLPRAESVDTVEAPVEPGVWRGRETVLVVDDDRDVRELAVACLSEYGYRVLEAGSGVESLEMLGREASIDLLLIDYAMPEMNGAETVRLARRVRPDLEVLFITGYADLRALSEHVGPHAIVQKPFKLAQLADRVAQGLARRAASTQRVA